MSKEFVESRKGSNELYVAKRQQEQLSYFTQSKVQDNITVMDLNKWADRNFATSDYFVSWVRDIFKQDNSLAFFKYMRYPLPSSKLVNDDILPQLNRVFTAEDAYRRYTVYGQPIEPPVELEFDKFTKELFHAYLFRHNDIVFTDLKDTNKPYREIISLDKVVAIDCDNDEIEKIAFKAEYELENGDEIDGYLYCDEYEYIFYDENYNVVNVTPHDLGKCPADFVSPEVFSDEPVVRKSLFSYVREELEDYDFLKTLRKMTTPNGAVPVVTMLQTENRNRSGMTNSGASPIEPMSSFQLKSQQPYIFNTVSPNVDGQLQAGSVIKVTPIKDAQGNIDMSIVTDYFKFHYMPVEALEYLDKRIDELKTSIISSVVGHYKDNVDVAKNKEQLNTGLIEKQDNLKRLAENLSTTITKCDFKFLALEYGKDNVSVDVFLGTDFFLESPDSLLTLLDKSPNPIEGMNILTRMNKNKYRNNPNMAKRMDILYKIMPYPIQKDFDTALSQGVVDEITLKYRLRFTHWVDMFEAEYGDIVTFWADNDYVSEKQRIVLINNLITSQIKVYEQENSASTLV